MEPIVLLVDDDQSLLNALKRTLHKERYQLVTAVNAEEALEILAGLAVDVIVSDQCMPGLSGIEFLSIVRQRYPETVRMMLTGQADLETAVAAINQGEIYRFFSKPCNEIDLAVTIREALQQRELISQSRRLLEIVKMQSSYINNIETENPGITQVKRNEKGAVVLEDAGYDLEQICREAEAQVEQAGKSFRKKL